MTNIAHLRCIAFVAIAALLIVVANSARAAWPERSVRMILPFPAGGPTDAIGRQLAQRLSDVLGQNVVVDNRAGGNSAIGSEVGARAAADGYTLLFNASIFAINPHLVKLPYDIHKDFTPIALVAKAPLAITVNNALPICDIRELIAYAKANPGKLNFGIGSNGSAGHLAQELLKKEAAIDIAIIPYKGSAPGFTDLIGGQIQGFTDPVLGALPHIKGARVRALAVTSSKRLAVLPDTPTVAESGLPGFEFSSWYGLWGPPGLPREIVLRLSSEVNNWIAAPATREQLEKLGYDLQTGTPESFARFVHDDSAASARIIRDASIKAE